MQPTSGDRSGGLGTDAILPQMPGFLYSLGGRERRLLAVADDNHIAVVVSDCDADPDHVAPRL